MIPEVGGYEVEAFVLGRLRLDGGAMFGSVPRALWARFHEPDGENRIQLVTRVLFLRAGGLRVLVDAGTGEKFGPRERALFAIEPIPPERWPIAPGDLTDVVLTHLHFDHAGGWTTWADPPGGESAQGADSALQDPGDGPSVTERSAPGRARAARPPGRPARARVLSSRARIHLQRENWLRANSPGVRERASYLEENVRPLEAAPLSLLQGDGEPLPGIRVRVSHGHTRGLQWVVVGEGAGAIAFPADLVPTATHVQLPYVMGYDMCVERLLEEKAAFLEEAARERWRVVFAHDPVVASGRIVRDARGRHAVEPL